MRWSEAFLIPSELATLYDFVNSLDLRRYRDRGGQHEAFDALVSPSQAANWLRTHGLWSSEQSLDEEDFQRTLALRSEEHTSELQSHLNLVCRLLLEKKKK